MGLLDCASANSIWRGYDYYKENKVSDIKNIADGVFEGTVRGSGTKAYSSMLDAFHPRKSKCNCPHADGKRIVCKHIVALYFTAYPEEAVRICRESIEYEEEQEKLQEELDSKLESYISKMRKSELEAALLQILYDGPEWQYNKFLREYLGEY